MKNNSQNTTSFHHSFGMSMVSYKNEEFGYTYKHQGQESDDEIYGEGAAYFYTYRMSDSRYGRFWSVDPLAPKYPHNSPYAYSENRVIDGIEMEGLQRVPTNELWDIKKPLTTAPIGSYSVEYKMIFINGDYHKLHQIESGANKGNWVGINQDGKYSFIVGNELVPESYKGKVDHPVAVGSYIQSWFGNNEFSSTLCQAQWNNYYGCGYYDESGEYHTNENAVFDAWAGIVTNPYNWVGAVNIMSVRNATASRTKVQGVIDHAKNNKGATQKGYKGNKPFANDGRDGGQILSKRDKNGNPITYTEYDVNPSVKGKNRGTERVVIGSDGSTYYTDNHYKTFIKIE